MTRWGRLVAQIRCRAGSTQASSGWFGQLAPTGGPLAEDADVEIRIVDESQRTIRTLVNGRQPAGEHAALWDQRDDAGGLVSNGTYRYIARIGTWEHEGRLQVAGGGK